jgi:hypothetical protein
MLAEHNAYAGLLETTLDVKSLKSKRRGGSNGAVRNVGLLYYPHGNTTLSTFSGGLDFLIKVSSKNQYDLKQNDLLITIETLTCQHCCFTSLCS